MAESLKIELDITGADKVASGFKKATSGADDLAKKMKQLNADTAKINKKAQADSLKIQQQAARSAARSAANARKMPGGTAQRLAVASLANQKAQAIGTDAQKQDAAYNLFRAKKAHQSAMASMRPVSRFSSAIASYAPEIAAFTSAVYLAKTAIETMADAINEFASNARTGGGTGAQTALATSFGISGETARAIINSIATNPIAATYAAKVGVRDYGQFDSTNKTEKVLRLAEELRSLPYEDALRTARAIGNGAEEILKYRNVSDATIKRLKQDAAIQESIYTPEQIRNAAEFSVSLGRVVDAFKAFMVSISGDILSSLTRLLNDIANALYMASLGARTLRLALETLFPGGKKSGDSMDKIRADFQNWEQKKLEATKASTHATEALNATLKDGIFGGGDRARGAIPAGWKGYNMDKWIGQSVSLGAFNL